MQKTAFHANLGRKAVDVSACNFTVVTETARVREAHKTGINIAASLLDEEVVARYRVG
jgi:hypothetical protein